MSGIPGVLELRSDSDGEGETSCMTMPTYAEHLGGHGFGESSSTDPSETPAGRETRWVNCLTSWRHLSRLAGLGGHGAMPALNNEARRRNLGIRMDTAVRHGLAAAAARRARGELVPVFHHSHEDYGYPHEICVTCTSVYYRRVGRSPDVRRVGIDAACYFCSDVLRGEQRSDSDRQANKQDARSLYNSDFLPGGLNCQVCVICACRLAEGMSHVQGFDVANPIVPSPCALCPLFLTPLSTGLISTSELAAQQEDLLQTRRQAISLGMQLVTATNVAAEVDRARQTAELQLTDLQSTLQQQQERIRELQSTLLLRQDRIVMLQSTLQRREDQVSQLQSTLQQRDEQLAEQSRLNGVMLDRLHESHDRFPEYADTIRRLDEQLEYHSTRADQLQLQSQQHADRIERLLAQRGKMAAIIRGSDERDVTHRRNIDELMEELRESQQRMQLYQAAAEEAKEGMENALASAVSLQEQLFDQTERAQYELARADHYRYRFRCLYLLLGTHISSAHAALMRSSSDELGPWDSSQRTVVPPVPRPEPRPAESGSSSTEEDDNESPLTQRYPADWEAVTTAAAAFHRRLRSPTPGPTMALDDWHFTEEEGEQMFQEVRGDAREELGEERDANTVTLEYSLAASPTYRGAKSFPSHGYEQTLPRTTQYTLSGPRAKTAAETNGRRMPETYSALQRAGHPPTPQEYFRQRPFMRLLTYVKQTERGSRVTLTYQGQVFRNLIVMLDSGSNVNLITTKTCEDLGISIMPTNTRLTTSNANGSAVEGVTPPILVTYGEPGNDLQEWHYFLVTPASVQHVYQVLLGNSDSLSYGAIQDDGTHQYSLRTQFSSLGVASPVITLKTYTGCPQRALPLTPF